MGVGLDADTSLPTHAYMGVGLDADTSLPTHACLVVGLDVYAIHCLLMHGCWLRRRKFTANSCMVIGSNGLIQLLVKGCQFVEKTVPEKENVGNNFLKWKL